ncbi:MAG: hypothetical protein IKO42_01030 [Opitutales bacterium]|nr:hypothetical protein [Opitutales bacterium]
MTKRIIILLSAATLACACAFADIRFKNIYQDHMVLQAGEENIIAGRTDAPAEKVQIRYKAVLKNGKIEEKTLKEVKSNKNCRWFAKLPAFPKRTVLEIEASADGKSAKIQDVITGELWIGAGQSNMHWHFRDSPVEKEFLQKCQEDADSLKGDIRIIRPEGFVLPEPIDEVCGQWRIIEGKTLKEHDVSQVCYLFASKISKALDTPVGFINSSWGGTRIEPWIPRSAFAKSAECKELYEELTQNTEKYSQMREDFIKNYPKWIEQNPTHELQNKNFSSRPQMVPKDVLTSTELPGSIYNAMIHGIAPLSPVGVLWYQGESNADRPYYYGELQKLLVKSWRKHFKRDFYFYYVELAAYMDTQRDPVQLHSWGGIRETQAEVLELPKTGVACSIDNGGSIAMGQGDIHPPHKEAVSTRLANMALAQMYKKGNPSHAISPAYKSMKIEGNKIVIELSHAEGLKLAPLPSLNTSKAEKLPLPEKITGFAIRGENPRGWKWADVEIKGNKLIVSSAEVAEPKAVRYAWAYWPLACLKNKYGLPLRPFSTDNGAYSDYNRTKNTDKK